MPQRRGRIPTRLSLHERSSPSAGLCRSSLFSCSTSSTLVSVRRGRRLFVHPLPPRRGAGRRVLPDCGELPDPGNLPRFCRSARLETDHVGPAGKPARVEADPDPTVTAGWLGPLFRLSAPHRHITSRWKILSNRSLGLVVVPSGIFAGIGRGIYVDRGRGHEPFDAGLGPSHIRSTHLLFAPRPGTAAGRRSKRGREPQTPPDRSFGVPLLKAGGPPHGR